ILSRPVSYISAVTRSNDGAPHNVQLYMGASSDIAANTTAQEIKAVQYSFGGLSVLKAGTKAQPVLQKKGDDLRIDWGYMYIAAPAGPGVRQSISKGDDLSNAFLPASNKTLEGKHLLLNTTIDIGKVGN